MRETSPTQTVFINIMKKISEHRPTTRQILIQLRDTKNIPANIPSHFT